VHNPPVHKALASLPPAWVRAGQAALLAAVYFGAAKLALLFAVPPGYASPVWPPSGIAVAALLLAGPRLWPGIWIASFAANLTVEASLVASALIATGSTLQALAARFLVERYVDSPSRFNRVPDVVKFLAVSFAVAVIAPTMALLPLLFGHSLDAGELVSNWWTWWQGDCSGILLVAPLVLSWAAPDTVTWTRRRALEGLAFWTLLVLATQLVFSGDFARTFLLVPFIVWAAFRFGQRGVTTATAAICAIALWSTLLEQTGPFATPPAHYPVLLLLMFISTLVVTGLVLCALLSQLQSSMLGETERRFRLMIENVVDYAIFMLDEDGRVTSWNAGAQRIKGYSAEEIIGQHFSRFYESAETAQRDPQRALDIARREGRYQAEGWRLRRDGSRFWANVVITALRDESGRLIGYSKVTRDLTERNRVEAELLHAKVAAEKASEAKSQFLANMSHELRTPLNSLLILARLLSDNTSGNLNAKQVQFAQTIYASGMDLLTLINDLLDLAKIESGAIKSIHVAPMLLDELREELERTFRQVAQDRGLGFSIVIEPGLPARVSTDGTRVKQVLKNLLANAFKFTQKGGVSLHIGNARSGWTAGHPKLTVAPYVLQFRVADTGIGIPAEKREMIFEAFQQADGTTSRQYGGTGLGLSISRELTRLLGGEIHLESEPGKGSTFTLYLPVAEELYPAPA
jgi:PAS domain S-box-containing protein